MDSHHNHEPRADERAAAEAAHPWHIMAELLERQACCCVEHPACCAEGDPRVEGGAQEQEKGDHQVSQQGDVRDPCPFTEDSKGREAPRP